jgi:hypothetical protein
MSQGVVFYQSIDRGLSNPHGDKAISYFGRVFRIPKSEHGTLRQLEWELNPQELLQSPAVDDDAPPTQPLADGIIERFEVIDQETGDIWVMYRVPQPREAGS